MHRLPVCLSYIHNFYTQHTVMPSQLCPVVSLHLKVLEMSAHAETAISLVLGRDAHTQVVRSD